MKTFMHALSYLSTYLPVLLATAFIPAVAAQDVTEIGGEKLVTLTRHAGSTSKPEFTSVTLAPGRGMELIQITDRSEMFSPRPDIPQLCHQVLADHLLAG